MVAQMSASTDKLGLAVIGASRFADFCLGQYVRLETLRAVGVWNRTTATGQHLAAKYGMASFESAKALLADPSVHIVHVATTPAHHAEYVMAALEHGKHVLCEKPLATNLHDARRLLDAARQYDRRLSVNFMMRYGPLCEPVRQTIASGTLGAALRVYVVNCAGDDGLPPGHWFWNRDESGGIFIEHGVHFFDLLRCWLGPGNVISAWQAHRPDHGPVDQVGCEMRCGEQTCVDFYHGFHQSHHMDRQEYRLIFERGEITLRGWVAGQMDLHAVLSDADVERLRALFPGAKCTIVERFSGADRAGSQRTGRAPVEARVRMHWAAKQDGQALYGEALRDLMVDFLASVRDRRHDMRVRAADGVAALEAAVEADRLANHGTDA